MRFYTYNTGPDRAIAWCRYACHGAMYVGRYEQCIVSSFLTCLRPRYPLAWVYQISTRPDDLLDVNNNSPQFLELLTSPYILTLT
jgi:hypothetical protein